MLLTPQEAKAVFQAAKGMLTAAFTINSVQIPTAEQGIKIVVKSTPYGNVGVERYFGSSKTHRESYSSWENFAESYKI